MWISWGFISFIPCFGMMKVVKVVKVVKTIKPWCLGIRTLRWPKAELTWNDRWGKCLGGRAQVSDSETGISEIPASNHLGLQFEHDLNINARHQQNISKTWWIRWRDTSCKARWCSFWNSHVPVTRRERRTFSNFIQRREWVPCDFPGEVPGVCLALGW